MIYSVFQASEVDRIISPPKAEKQPRTSLDW